MGRVEERVRHAQQQPGRELRVDRLQLAALHAASQHPRDPPHELRLVNLVERAPATLGADVHHLLAGHPDQCARARRAGSSRPAMARSIRPRAVDSCASASSSTAAISSRLAFEDRHEQLLLILEVVVQRGLGDADRLADLPHRHALVARARRTAASPRPGCACSVSASPLSRAIDHLCATARARAPVRLHRRHLGRPRSSARTTGPSAPATPRPPPGTRCCSPPRRRPARPPPRPPARR